MGQKYIKTYIHAYRELGVDIFLHSLIYKHTYLYANEHLYHVISLGWTG